MLVFDLAMFRAFMLICWDVEIWYVLLVKPYLFEINIHIMHPTVTLHKKAIIHQVTTMLTTSQNVLFPGPIHMLTTDADEPTLWLSTKSQRVKGHQQRWLTGGYRTWK